MPEFKLLQQLERTFRDGPYVHRNSNLGNRIADYLYEDLYDLDESRKFRQRVDAKRRVLNPKNVSPGIHARRGDGSFGTPVPGSQPTPGFRSWNSREYLWARIRRQGGRRSGRDADGRGREFGVAGRLGDIEGPQDGRLA